MKINILFGTESGTAEFVAGDIENKLRATVATSVSDLAEFSISSFSREYFYIIVCSTYGEGDPPSSARPFLEHLASASPDLSNVRFALFGLGDSSYPGTFNQGSDLICQALEKCGATRIGEFGRHDASGREHPSDSALLWLEKILPCVSIAAC